MKLSQLCLSLIDIPAKHDVEVKGLALDSRDVQPGYLFLACPGTQVDGHDFIHVAISRGAVAVLCEASRHIFNEMYITTEEGQEVPIFAVPHLLQMVGSLSARFYQDPTENLCVYGVTGTNGKTSVTHYLAACLDHFDLPCAVLGTVGNGFLKALHTSSHTTANPIALQAMLAQYKEQGAKTIAMEVSSHGLDQGRVKGIHFTTAIFTNLTRDHLDYHGSMENYAAAKHKLFSFPDLKNAIFNLDDAYGLLWWQEFRQQFPCYGYTVNETSAENSQEIIQAFDVQYHAGGISAKLRTPWGEGKINLALLGSFNLSNVLAVIAALGTRGIALEAICQQVSQLSSVAGRMELIHAQNKPVMVIDYAHTPDALEKALLALREHTPGRIWCVFGCGGDRDKGKRPEMGSIAERLADHIILTNDNPRHEKPEQIIAEIVAGLSNQEKMHIIYDRQEAIAAALSQAKAGDIVLVAGKGHEDYQQIGDKKLPFSDRKVITNLLRDEV